MPALSVAEAKELAHYVKHSHAHIFNTVPLGKWLTAISRACGFRDWNVMSVKAPKLPDSPSDDWGDSGLGFAVVCAPGRATSYHLIHDRSNAWNMVQVAEKLAQRIASGGEHRFSGATSKFSLLDPAEPIGDWPVFNLPIRRKHSTALPPVQVTIADGEVTIWLWWLSPRYLLRAGDPGEPETLAFYSLHEQSMTPKNECVTSLFLRELTGKVLPRKHCYYCTELPNERHIFRLMLVQEGSRDGQATQYTYDNHESAARQKIALNSSLGLSERDAQAVSAVFAQYDPYYEEDYFDDYSHNND
ncbi:hypothetical protein [Pseudomonas cichorii]|uniref:hypothetical protein n=1 Tax=Pseudomonas cichorii TaxID=36746 RepID=UPI001C8A0D03|nr:hypothetical protein [Pseudomonas cichorii]MBX8486147.1 hypothetical protein [Pseudomonas cichorii]